MLTFLLTAALLAAPQGQDGEVGVVEAGANAALSSLDPARTLLFHADKVAIGDGRVLDGGWVAVEDGVVKAVGTDLDPKGFATCELAGWLVPGLLSLHGYEGAEGETIDTTRPVMPDVDLSAGSCRAPRRSSRPTAGASCALPRSSRSASTRGR